MLRGKQAGVTKNAARFQRVLGGHEVGMRTGRPLARELQHLHPQGGQQDRRGRIRHGRPIGRIPHRFEIGTHRAEGTLVLMPAGVHQRHVADADPENESVRPGFGQRPAAVHHRGRVAHPDAGDPGGDRHVAG